MDELFALYPAAWPVLAGLLGLVVGSFLNVVVHRLPLMLEREWRRECRLFLELEPESPEPSAAPFNLAVPGSHCPACRKPLRALENIPLLSYVALGGRCAGCGARISPRYPLTEALSALLSALVAWRLGPGLPAAAALLLSWGLLALSLIDLDRQLLPDTLTLPLLWLGLILSLVPVFAGSDEAILGAVFGYGSLWLVHALFLRLTGRTGMGHGDFKLLALLGAWLGWTALPLIILLSSLVGALSGLFMILFLGHDRRQPIPFGPYLAAAGWVCLLWGESLATAFHALLGLP